jgi:hypothetical protein
VRFRSDGQEKLGKKSSPARSSFSGEAVLMVIDGEPPVDGDVWEAADDAQRRTANSGV